MDRKRTNKCKSIVGNYIRRCHRCEIYFNTPHIRGKICDNCRKQNGSKRKHL